VRLGRVTRESIADTVSYSGQAVGFVEQDVNPRVQGVIQWMPVYVGDRVEKGQVLARLDTSQLDPQLAERSAMADMASQGVGVASAEYEAALQEAVAARAEVAAREGMVGEADAMLAASRQEREAVEAELAAVRTEVGSAEAEVSAAEVEAKFRSEELRRSRELFAKGAISKSELQQSDSESAAADAKLRQARSMQRQAESRVAAASAQLRKADAMVAAAQRRLRQAEADVRAAKASVLARESAARAAKQNIAKERAAAAQARAGLQGAAAQLRYSSIEAEVDGVVTERLVSPGVLVNPGQAILRVAQISPIRIQANIPTGDLTRIARGSAVSILVGEGNAEPVRSRVSSVSQSVDARARTGIVEAVIRNTDGRFMPGQFVEMRVEVGRATSRLTVPIEAVYRRPAAQGQEAAFVWVADQGAQAGTYAVRRVEVSVGASDGKRVAVDGELIEGQNVVTYGGAYLREGGEVTSAKEGIAVKGPVVEVMSTHYLPDKVDAEFGKPITITFVRRTEEGCGTEVSFPELGIRKHLPLNTPVEVTFTPRKTGEIKFTCAMDMFRGRVVVR
jgi:RND family efflux transporter MFP subunit